MTELNRLLARLDSRMLELTTKRHFEYADAVMKEQVETPVPYVERTLRYRQALENIALICSGETWVGYPDNWTTDDEGRLTLDAKEVIQDQVTRALKHEETHEPF